MNNKFDELTKSMAQSVTRRGALKRFGLGLAGMALACFGLASKAGAARPQRAYCQVRHTITFDQHPHWVYTGLCVDSHGCATAASADCPANGTLEGDTSANQSGCGGLYSAYDTSKRCSFAI